VIGPNLSEWSSRGRALTIYLMLIAVIAGCFAFFGLGRDEDPIFTIKTMLVTAVWPGATMDETLDQITNRLERRLQETTGLDALRSITRPGVVTIYVDLDGAFPPEDVPAVWQEVRNGIGDIRQGLEFMPEPTGWMTLIPTIYNADTLGIRPDLIERPIETWAELLNPEFKGKASILDISSIGIMDMAMVCEAMGEVAYGDKGNMTTDEIDRTIAIFTEAKRAGQFRAFWKSFDESVNLMASGEVVIQSMWSPAITAVKSRGIPCVYQPLKEGYRSWGGGLGLSKSLTGLELDAAYEYIDWYLSGWVGGFLMRQGYYSAVPDTSKTFMSENEWGYWYEGKPATAEIVSPTGDVLGQAGDVRDGGSYMERMGKVACWNSVMDENQYMVRKWNEFIAA